MIPDAAVEAAVVAAAKVLYADNMSNHAGDNAPQIIDACEAVARKMMHAAAPHLMASAWDEAVAAAEARHERIEYQKQAPDESVDETPLVNPYRKDAK